MENGQAPDNGDAPRRGATASGVLVALRRRWLAAAFVAGATVATAAVVTLKQTKIYASSAVIVIERQQVRPLGSQVESLEQPGHYWYFEQEYRTTQMNVIKSRPVLSEVARRLRLGSNLDFLGVAELPPEAREEMLAKLDPVKVLRGRLSVEPVRDSMLARVTVEDRDPQRAALLATEIVSAYAARRRQAKIEVAASAIGWLDEQATSLRASLDGAEHNLLKFQKENDIRATSFESHKDLVARKQAALSDELLKARRQQWELSSRLSTFDALGDDPSRVLDSPLAEGNQGLQETITDIMKLEQEFLALSTRYGPAHPAYKEVSSKLEVAKRSLATDLQRIESRLRLRKKEVDLVVRRAEAALAELRNDALKLNERTITYQRLNYEIENYRTLYALVVKRTKEAQIGEMAQFVDVEVVEAPVSPTFPIRPRKRLNLLAGLFLGVLLGAGAALGLELLDTRLADSQEAEGIVGRPHLGSLQDIDAKDLQSQTAKLRGERKERFDGLDDRRRIELYPLLFPKSNTAESLRLVRTNFLFTNAGDDANVFLVTSANPQEGKSTMVNYLGLSLAAMGDKRIVVLDTDLHRPMLHKAYGLPNKSGVSNLIVGSAQLDEVVQSTDVDGLDVITSGPIPPNSAELLGYPRFEQLVQELRGRYDYVLLDSPPVLALSDALVLSRMASSLLLVVRPDVTNRPALRHAVRQLTGIQAPMAGFVFNRIRTPKRGRYYGLGGYYGYSRYGQYYYRGRYSGYGYSYQSYGSYSSDGDDEETAASKA